jgi:hypothetical protein
MTTIRPARTALPERTILIAFLLFVLVGGGASVTIRITSDFLVRAGLVFAGVLVDALLPSKEKPAAVDECKDRSGQVLPRCA